MKLNTGERPEYDIKVETQTEETTDKDFELILNQAQVDSNSILRTILTFEDTYLKVHFVVY